MGFGNQLVVRFLPVRSMCIPEELPVNSDYLKLGLLDRSQDDWKAADELTKKLKTFDPSDPVKYDFALFGLGVFEKF